MKRKSTKMDKENASGPAGNRQHNHPPQKPLENDRHKTQEGDIRKVKEKEVVNTKTYDEEGNQINTSPKEENRLSDQPKGPAY